MAKRRANESTGNPMLDKLNEVIASCNETAELCERCKACGLDVDQEQQQNAEQLKVAESLKREFFPDKV